MVTATAAQEDHAHHLHRDGQEEKHTDAVLTAMLGELAGEFHSWAVDGMPEWEESEELMSTATETKARQRYWDEVELDEKSTHGADIRVELYWPLEPSRKYPMTFHEALNYAYDWFSDVFKEVAGEPVELKKIANCVFQLLSLYVQFLPCRWHHHAFPAFQSLLELLLKPNEGIYVVVRDWIKAPQEEKAAKQPKLEAAWVRALTSGFEDIKEVRKHHYVTDAALPVRLDELIQQAQGKIFQPSAEDLRMFHHFPKPFIGKEWSAEQLTRVLVEARSAWAEHDFGKRFSALKKRWGNEATEEEWALTTTLKSGRLGLFKRHYDVLEKRGFAASPEGVKHLCRELSRVASAGELVVRRLCKDIGKLAALETLPEVPTSLEGLTIGRRVWAFYDTYMQAKQWRYRFVHVDEPPDSFPLEGLAAGWLPGTIVARPQLTGVALDGFARVSVRFDGLFCDSRLVSRHLAVKASGNNAFVDKGTFSGRSCDRNKTFMIPVALLRDINDAPEQPLLSVLNLRPMDYYSNPKHSDYNICNDGYVQDIFHGPCSMRERIPGKYEVRTVFVKETADLDKLDAPKLRARLAGRNRIGWYFQWPQIQSKSLWGNGSVRRQSFFDFCTRAERAGVRTGWPHDSHIYDLLAGKLWIPKMSLCADFKVMPTAVIDFARFKRNPAAAVKSCLEHIAHIRKVVWGWTATPIEAFKGVVKFGYSWCGTDVMPFVGSDGLLTVCEQMFSKEGNEHTTIMVQEMLPSVFAECRNLCFFDKRTGKYHKERLWVAQMQKLKHSVEGFSGLASSNVLPSHIVGKNCLGGDFEALHKAEAEADALCDRWLHWLRTELPNPIHYTRIDFLVAKGDEPGQAKVWTCEVGECGGSMCSVEVHGRNTVTLNNAIMSDPRGCFPAALPLPLPRNDGMKSH